MYTHEVHLINGGTLEIKSPEEMPVLVDASDNLLKFAFANGTTYTFVVSNVLYYVTKKGV